MKSDLKNFLSKLYGFIDLSLIAFLVYDFGFTENKETAFQRGLTLMGVTLILLIFSIIRRRLSSDHYTRMMFTANIGILILIIITILISWIAHGFDLVEAISGIKTIIEIELLGYFVLRLMKLIRKLYHYHYNPAILFVGSFALIAFTGALLLMLPNATTESISFIDALFTATSAVCVTGLIVVDTAHDFTFMGQSIIMVLFQLGGIGMLTFTSFFAYFFKGGSSFQEGLYVKDFVGIDNISNVLKTAMRVVAFTFTLEFIGAIFIYISVLGIPELDNKIFFSIFHAISAFCNAGFSTMSDGLYDTNLRFVYAFQWMVIVLIIFGGLGYGIVENIMKYLKHIFQNLFNAEKRTTPVRMVTLNSKIVLVTSAILLVVGTIFISVFEYGNVLREHSSWWGKFTTAGFTSVTTRTAGFNTVDVSALSMPSLLFVMLLMWIGASPASTGGGIKTSTFALATLNIFAIIRGRQHIEIGTRRVSNDSVRRAFAIMSISLICIGIAILLLLFFEKGFTLIQIGFEVFSAYSTVGLSMGITGDLSNEGKAVVIAVMFIGRIGLINLMIGMIRQLSVSFHEYPEEKILIN